MKADKLVRRTAEYRSYIPGVTKIQGGVHICVKSSGEELSLVICEEGKRGRKQIPFSPDDRIGDIWTMELMGEDFSGLIYCLEEDGKEVPDPCGKEFAGRERWGDSRQAKKTAYTRLVCEDYDWEGDRPLKHSYNETILYRLHVRGFTKHPSSRTENRGTFQAITEKIPYLKNLGVTAVELMPPNEFTEVLMENGADGNPYATGEPTGKINYWGYGESWLFAPKSAYASGAEKHAVREFRDLVKELHRNGIEIVIELYFTGKEGTALIQEAVRSWVYDFHVDGIHLTGAVPADILADDPLLADTKLFALSWNGRECGEKVHGRRHLAEYNDGFMIDMRRVLKGDEDQISGLIFRNRRNPAGFGVINYMANTNSLTMMDMVSYERKHNEANGEGNRDGSDYNYTWNCGAEGPSRKKKILQMRRKQLRNAFVLLFLSQGTPLIQAGDEFGDSAGGNNNAYCQDNSVSWLNWDLLESNRDIFEFVKYMIEFRKKHSVFHMDVEPKNIDYLACGHPDVSYHGVKAWCPEFENFRRQLGIMYCGEYGRREGNAPDDYFFVAYNMHWEPHEFALPKLPKEQYWHICLNTDDDEINGIYGDGMQPRPENQKQFLVPSRSIVVFRGLEDKKEAAVSGKGLEE